MPWLKLKLFTDHAHADQLAESFEEWGAISVTLQDAGDEPVFDTYWDQTPLWSQVQIIGLFPQHTDTDSILASVRERFNLAQPPAHEIDLLGDEDWAHSWMAHYKPLQVGHNLWVVPSWCSAPQPDAVNIILDPGLAFGTGDHPTTSLCLEWLAQQHLAGKIILDYGCGSGILAIAALKLGAREVHAVDIDPQALQVTQQNAIHNGLHSGLHVSLPTLLPPNFQADIVLANILMGTLIELAPEIQKRVNAAGWLVLSGMLAGQEIEVRAHYEPPFALTLKERQKWVLLAGHRSVDLG
ncbi:MAG: 50S ribosomal protein L11 methyltransferase [Gammaproteobacteria bacterium]|nr:50S ribosomal protein L11 methyltransferase [Gammaproteobacteria bacterium]